MNKVKKVLGTILIAFGLLGAGYIQQKNQDDVLKAQAVEIELLNVRVSQLERASRDEVCSEWL